MQKSEDLRVLKTRKLLQQALFELVTEKGFASITVNDIAKRAMVNRSTFYRHYLDKYDLLNQYVDELQTTITEAVTAVEKSDPQMKERVPVGLLLLVQHVQEYPVFYRVMLGQNGDAMFTQRFRQLPANRYRFLFTQYRDYLDSKAPPIDMKLHYISCAVLGALLWWLENDQPCSAEQLAIWLGQLCMTSAGLPTPLPPPLPSTD